jgi:hypothetical protein
VNINKSNEEFNYKMHGSFDVSGIAACLESYSDQWLRRARDGFSKTTSFFIYDHPIIWSIQENFKPKVIDNNKEMHDLLSPIITYLEGIHNGKVAKCLFVKLPAGENVEPHVDKMNYLGVVRRHHIAIQTNDQVLFFVNNEEKNMKVGDCWEVNNNKEHAVKNLGQTDRIHLMIDIMPNQFIK